MNINHKKLPRGWVYIVSIRQIKEFIRQTEADVRLVEFTGTGRKPCKITQGHYAVANLDARVDGSQWCYRFSFTGLSEKVLPSDRTELAELVLADIAEFTSRPTGQPLDTTVSPEHRIMFFRLDGGKLSPSFSTEKQSNMDDQIEMYDRNRWWENTTQQTEKH